MTSEQIQIAIDGPAASGKSTIARGLAKKLGCFHVNTGDMYRALTSLAIKLNIDPVKDEKKIVELLKTTKVYYETNEEGTLSLKCNGDDVEQKLIRSPKTTAQVSYVAKIPEVRIWMKTSQRNTASLGLIVMEGRDIATVIFPKAKYKFFVTASPLVRAKRRLAQDGEVIAGDDLESVAADIAKRDEMDMNRKVSPLKPAEDSRIIDTSDYSASEIVDQIISQIDITPA